MSKFSIVIFMIIAFSACTTIQTNPEKWTDDEVNQWFEKREWLSGWGVLPDASINRRSLAIHYHKNQRCWDQAFQFLKTADLNNIPAGKQELEGQHLFITMGEYVSKNLEETRYESHKKYIDIQYVIRGEELMGLTTLDKVKLTEPYNDENDISFFEFEGGEYIKATPGNFLVFFPEDVHRPSVKTDLPVDVKKIVVKILIE